MKRAPTKRKKKAKVPERSIPVVDAVVEMVFSRLAEAAAKAKQADKKKGSSRRTGASSSSEQSSPEPDEQRGLAGAVADLLLAHLTRDASVARKTKAPAKKRTKRQR